MLKLDWYCCSCGSEGHVPDELLDCIVGQCPNCGCHHGEVEYECKMSKEEFEAELASMSERDKEKYAYAIDICREQFESDT